VTHSEGEQALGWRKYAHWSGRLRTIRVHTGAGAKKRKLGKKERKGIRVPENTAERRVTNKNG